MIQRDSYEFATFTAVRVGEIEENTNPSDWFWIKGEDNVADYATHCKNPSELLQSGIRQRGPDFLRLEESKWPISHIVSTLEIPDQIKSIMCNDGAEIDSLERRINVARYSSYIRLTRVICRILSMYNKAPKLSFSNVSNKLLKVERKLNFFGFRMRRLSNKMTS